MVTDSEPRYRLVDGNGNPVGSVYAEPDGTLKLQEGSGSDNEAVLQPDGTLSVPSVNTGNVSLDPITGDGLLSHAIEHGKVFADDGTIHDSITSALIAASSIVYVGPGTFQENVTTGDVSIIGSGPSTIVDGGDDTAIRVENDALLSQISATTTNGSGTGEPTIEFFASNRSTIRDVWVNGSDKHGVFFNNSADCRIIGLYCDMSNIGGNGVRISTNSDNNIIDDVTGTVTDNGTNNIVGDTA